jgi:hypothetical protein
MSPTATTRRAWLNRFFAAYYARRPVNATFIGVHEYDGRLPDSSEAGLGDMLSEMRALLEAAPQEPFHRDHPLAGDPEALDVRLATGFLRTAMWEAESGHVHHRNPTHYTGEAVFGLLSLFLHHDGSASERVESAIERMTGVVDLLAQGRWAVRDAPAAWTERALRECDGGLALFTEGARALAAERDIDEGRFLAAADRAARAFSDHRPHLEAELARTGPNDPSCGEEAFELHLREAHFLTESADEIARYAEAVIEEVSAELDQGAAAFGAEDPSDVTSRLLDRHPDLDGYLSAYEDTWARMRAVAEERALVTWPDFPIRYVPRPKWVRACAPHLYFLFYRSPAAFGRPAVHDYFVTPIEASLPASEREALLRAHDDSVIKLNHVIHHGGLGHHVQNWHALRAASRIGRVAAVDCAARIAMPCGGTMAEGWACYATDLMAEVGALTPLEAYAERRGRVRMAARAVVDVRLHQGRFTPEEAEAYYRRVAAMTAGAARAEVAKNGMFPGGAVMYLVGTDMIHRLRRDVERIQGNAFSLRRFHDGFLSHGSVPVCLIAERMTSDAAEAAGSPAP